LKTEPLSETEDSGKGSWRNKTLQAIRETRKKTRERGWREEAMPSDRQE